jgi:hypothetical protein
MEIEYPATAVQFYSDTIRMKVIYSDYQTLDGVTSPTVIQRFINNQPLPVLRITALNVHQTFDSSSLAF